MTYAEPGDIARPYRINARFAADELEIVREAAMCAGLTPTRYLAEAALYVAHTHATRHLDPMRRVRGELADVTGELSALRGQLLDPAVNGEQLLGRIAQALAEIHAAAARLRTMPPL